MDHATLLSWWSHRQGLDGSLAGSSAAQVLDRSGWARSIGGCGPYLTIFSRSAIGREAADSAVARLEIHELPSARGCTYVLPASDFALGLKIAQSFEGGEMKVAEKLGVTAREIDKLCDAVVAALERGPVDPEGLREATGRAVRNLGTDGQKKGLATTLPVALGRLQTEGEIRRVPTNGRLDQQRYKYALWRPNPLHGFSLSLEEVHIELARRFFSWIAPATLADFQAFAGIGVKAAKAAVAPLGLEPLARDDDRLLLPTNRAALQAFRPPKEPCYALVGNLDSILLLPREADVRDLPSPAILDRGRLVGQWEYDPVTESIAWKSSVKKNRQLLEAIAHTEEYVRLQLGDARSFSLDSPKSRAPRIEALRKAATV